MSDDERYEQLKQDIGWYTTRQDVVLFVVLAAAVWLLVALS